MPKQIEMKDVSKYPLIFFNKEYPHFNELLISEFAKAGVSKEPTFESPNVGTLKRVIESGLGWGFLPSLSIKKQVRMGRLNHVQVKEMSYGVEFYYYSRKNADNKALLEVFYQAMQQQDRA
jgi:DNA-binding transcriptional LysR family regulator